VHLILVATEHNLLESWVSQNPELILVHFTQYFLPLRLRIFKAVFPKYMEEVINWMNEKH